MFSHAREVAAYRERRKGRMAAAAALYIVVAVAFTIWRATVFNPEAMVASVIFYAAEVYGCLLGFAVIFSSWNCRVREIPVAKKRHSVDVFVPVYTEPAEMIEMTVIGAKGIDYPHETWLLDDGRRDEIRAIAEKHGVHYVTREDNRGAKAGNLNHAMAMTKGELVAVFDADHIAQRESLEKLVGFFDDGSVGMVQAPQVYYNHDSFLYADTHVGGGRWHEQAHFMDVVQASRDSYDGCSGIGTGAVYRREAVDAIGGFPEETLTEDLHTSLRMHKRGMKTVYFNEPIAWGVAAADVTEFYKTRRRWAHGNLQVFRAENVLFCRGLSLRQRLGYIAMALHNLEGWQQAVYLLMPPYCLIFYATPFLPNLLTMTLVLGVPLVTSGLMVAANGGYVRFVKGQIFSMGKMFILMSATQGLFGVKMGWRVSRKNVLGEVAWGNLLPHIGILLVSWAALTFAVLRVTGMIPSAAAPVGGMVVLSIASGWVMFNVWRSWRWIRDSIRLTRRTHEEFLFEARIPILDEEGLWIATTERISTIAWEGGAGFRGREIRAGDEIAFLLPGCVARARVVETIEGEGFRYECVDAGSRDRMQRALHSVDWHRLLRLARRSMIAAREGLGGDWLPARLRADGEESRWGAIVAPAEGEWVLVTTERLAPGLGLNIDYQRVVGEKRSRRMRVGAEIRPETSIPKCLNNQNYYFYNIDNPSPQMDISGELSSGLNEKDAISSHDSLSPNDRAGGRG